MADRDDGIELGIDTAPRGPLRPGAGRRKGRGRAGPAGPQAMNGVGLVSLLCALASYVPSSLGWAFLLQLVRAGSPPSDPDAYGMLLAWSVLGLLPSCLGLLVCYLGRQRVVRPFSLYGVALALVPFVVGLVGAARSAYP